MPAPAVATQIYGYHYEKYHIKTGEVIDEGFSRVDVTGMKTKVEGFAFRVTPVAALGPQAVKQSAAAAGRIAELESVLESVDQEFRQHGNNFPDGFNSRVFGWVSDVLAGKALPRRFAGKKAAVVAGHEAFDADAAKRLRAICGLLGLKKAVPEDDATLMGALFAVLGMVRRAVTVQQAAASAREAAIPSAELLHDVCDTSDILMEWCVKNVHQWNFPQYDHLDRVVAKLRALLPPQPVDEYEQEVAKVG